MNAKDFTTITASGVLAAALAAFAHGFGLDAPLWVPAVVPLATGAVLAGLRAYVAIRGAANTTVDERLDAAEDAIAALRAVVKK